MNSAQRIIQLLGYAGLAPFVVPALLVVAGSKYSALSLLVAQAYAFGIISFLTGSWWGSALAPGSRAALLLSNLVFLVAFFVFAFALQWWTLAAALLLLTIFLAEHNSAIFAALPRHYRKMRAILTGVASAAMLTLHFAA